MFLFFLFLSLFPISLYLISFYPPCPHLPRAAKCLSSAPRFYSTAANRAHPRVARRTGDPAPRWSTGAAPPCMGVPPMLVPARVCRLHSSPYEGVPPAPLTAQPRRYPSPRARLLLPRRAAIPPGAGSDRACVKDPRGQCPPWLREGPLLQGEAVFFFFLITGKTLLAA